MADYLESYKRTGARASASRIGVIKDPTILNNGLSILGAQGGMLPSLLAHPHSQSLQSPERAVVG